MSMHGFRRPACAMAALFLAFLVGCQPTERSSTGVRMIAPPRTTAVERPVRTADPIQAEPQQVEMPAAAPETPTKPHDADSVEDRHPSRWPKKLRAKFAMLVDER